MKKAPFTAKSNFNKSSTFIRDNTYQKENHRTDRRAITLTSLKTNHLTISKKYSTSTSKQSNFQQLKNEIKCLENSQFLSLNYRSSTQPDQREEIKYRVTGKQFMPSKKVTQLQKFKLYLRRRGKNKRISMLLEKKQLQQSKDYNCLNYLEVKDINACIKEQNLKKKETPSIVKKYFRPLSSKNMSMENIVQKENQVRGRSLKSSASSRPEKENILIYCF